MKNPKTIYTCQKCGTEFLRWSGKCESCGEWNSLAAADQGATLKRQKTAGQVLKPVSFSQTAQESMPRIKTGIPEFDQVLGGGLIPGSVVLLGGEPGIGKSTLILQAACQIDLPMVLYVSGEESASQINMRINRLGIKADRLSFLAEMDIDNIIATIKKNKPPLVVIDSIQMLLSQDLASVPGSITQVREAAGKIIEVAKTLNVSVILVGHITKEGNVAGPKTLEHLVDTVLYLEGDRYHTFRILRGAKNRFGSTNEVGVFEMQERGLIEVKNPAGLFLEERQANSVGSVVTSVVEGNRAFLVEIQGLTSQTVFGYPKRTASGYDVNRLQLLIAVLTKRAGLKLHDRDVYLNIVGGFKTKEPAIDLAVCLSIASAFTGKNLDPEMIVLGEVGLAGEVRSMSYLEKRINEAKKLGFKRVLLPKIKDKIKVSGCEIIKVGTVKEAISKVL